MRLLSSAMLAVTVTVPITAGSAFAQESERPQGNDPALEEWEVPWVESRPRDPYVAPDGRVWFVGQRSHYAAVLDPATGEFKKYDLPEGAGPHTVVVGTDGMVWYTGNRVGNIGRIDPATGEIEIFPMPDERARDPHTFAFDAAGDLWFTVQGGNFVGKFWRETGDVRAGRDAGQPRGARRLHPSLRTQDGLPRPALGDALRHQPAGDGRSGDLRAHLLRAPRGCAAPAAGDRLARHRLVRGLRPRIPGPGRPGERRGHRVGQSERRGRPPVRSRDRRARPRLVRRDRRAAEPLRRLSTPAPSSTSARWTWRAAAGPSATCTSTRRPASCGSAPT